MLARCRLLIKLGVKTYNVHGRVGRNVTETSEDQGHTDLANQRHLGEHASKSVDDEGRDETSQPEVLEAFVNSARREQMLGADSTPNDTSVVEGLDRGTGEGSLCCLGADVLDSAHGPFDCGELAQTGPDSGDKLGSEQRSLGHMHVVTELQILTEVQSLSHDNVSEGLEHHHGDGVTGLDVTDDELGEYVETQLNVGESLDDTDRNGEDGGNDQ